MQQKPEEFARDLREMIDERRTFGAHPLWVRILDGELSREELGIWAVQFFLQVREFPRAVSALHSSCPYPDERIKLAESVYEEETGRISGCNLPHPELFIRFGLALGLEREAMTGGVPLPGTLALIDWFELSSKQRPFIEGAAAITLAAEGQVPGSFAPMARSLEKNYGLSREAVAFWDVHEEADRDHSAVGDHVVIHFADTEEGRTRVRMAVSHSLAMWRQFFDSIDDEIGRAS